MDVFHWRRGKPSSKPQQKEMTIIYSLLKRVVRNDAVRVDPPEIYNWRVLTLAASVGSICLRSVSLAD
jgi:hypothetical protein